MLFYSTGLKYFYIFHMFSFMAQYSYILIFYIQFSSVQLLRHVWLFVTPWAAARQASLSITNSQSLLKFMSIESVMPSNYLILCHPLLLPPSIFPSIRVFSNESVLHIRWPKYWSFNFSISPSDEYSGLISPFPYPGHLPNPGIKPRSPTLWADSLLADPQGKLNIVYITHH